jgi:hypothetical protein
MRRSHLRFVSMHLDRFNGMSMNATLVFDENGKSVRLIVEEATTLTFDQAGLMGTSLCVEVKDVSDWGWDIVNYEIRELEVEKIFIQARRAWFDDKPVES